MLPGFMHVFLRLVLTTSILLLFGLAIFVACVLCSHDLQMEIIYLNRMKIPFFADLSDPASLGLENCENFYLSGQAGRIGAWYAKSGKGNDADVYALYLHGNGGTRAKSNRIDVMKGLVKLGVNVLAIDYRGYGDSDGWPTEDGLVEDSWTAYKWLLTEANGKPIYIFCSSLGSAVGIQLATKLEECELRTKGLVLFSPFNKVADVFRTYWLSQPIVFLAPFLSGMIDDIEQAFDNEKYIQGVKCPVLILHDTADHVVSIELGRKLFRVGKKALGKQITMIEFDEGLRHYYIFEARDMLKILSNFISSAA